MNFNFNGHGSYELPQQALARPRVQMEKEDGKTIITLDENKGHRPNSVYTASCTTGRTWHLKTEEKDDIATAFHMAGLFVDRVFPELKETGYRFVRKEFSVQLIIGDTDNPTGEQYSSTYSPTKTFKNPHYSDKECAEMNFRLVPENANEFGRTLHLALNALENYAHGKPLPESHKISSRELKHL